MIASLRVPVALGLIVLTACAPTYEAATLSTLTPRSRVLPVDSTRGWIEVQRPELLRDTLFSADHNPIPVDSIARVEAEQRMTQGSTLAIVAGVLAGLAIAAAVNGSGE